ncbi:MAG: hypothetical protein KAJ18_04065 [Candidatus Omnitrophica bacterium]|nr:hypothetical protein [Candidatus Omnitrophota bacterium]
MAVSVDFLLKNYSLGPEKPLLTEMVLKKPIPLPEPEKARKQPIPSPKTLSEEEMRVRIERVIGKKIPPRLDSAVQDFERCQDRSYEEIIAALTQHPPDLSQLYYLALIALFEGKEDKCNLIPSAKERSYCLDLFRMQSGIAFTSSCAEVKDESLKTLCSAAIPATDMDYKKPKRQKANLEERCSPKTGYQLIKCKAMISGDLTICDQLEKLIGKEGVDGCKSIIYADTALKESNSSLCEKINRKANLRSELNYFKCQLPFLSKTNETQKQLFREELLQIFREKMCYAMHAVDMAIEKNDLSVCEKIPWKNVTYKPVYEACLNKLKKE